MNENEHAARTARTDSESTYNHAAVRAAWLGLLCSLKISDMPEKLYTETEVKAAIREAQTIQLLRLRNELFQRTGMSQRDFDTAHFGGSFGDYEREIAKREGIPLA